MGVYYVGGEFVDESEATLSVNDISILRGFGVFDFLRTYNRKPFHLMDHVIRFRNSAQLIGMDLKESNEEICDIIQQTIDKNPDYKEANVRFLCTGGVSSDGVSLEGNGKLLVMVRPLHQLPASWYTEGTKVITVDTERYIPGAKSINYLNAVIAQHQAKQEGGVEAIYVSRTGAVLEGTTTNIFFVKDGECHTPKDQILHGITRAVLLDLLKDDFKIVQREIKKEEIPNFDEVFMTASNKEVVPIVQINDQIIGDGKVGQATKQIINKFRDYTEKFGNDEVSI